jgi:hypothetical protein
MGFFYMDIFRNVRRSVGKDHFSRVSMWLYRGDAFLRFKEHFAPVRDLETGSKMGVGVVSFPGSILLSDISSEDYL